MKRPDELGVLVSPLVFPRQTLTIHADVRIYTRVCLRETVGPLTAKVFSLQLGRCILELRFWRRLLQRQGGIRRSLIHYKYASQLLDETGICVVPGSGLDKGRVSGITINLQFI